MFDDLIKNIKDKGKSISIECPVCKQLKLKEYDTTEHKGWTYRNFECEECGSAFSMRSLGL